MTTERLECERLIYDVMNTLDDSKKRGESPNAEFFAKIFAKMSDKEFEEYYIIELWNILHSSISNYLEPDSS